MEAFSTKKIFFKYMFSALLIFAIPLTIIIILVYSISYNLFNKELHAKNATSVHFDLSNATAILDHCLDLNNEFIYSDYIEPFKLQQSPNEGIRVIDTLQDYIMLNPNIEDIIVHFYEDDYFYSSDTSILEPSLLQWLSSSFYEYSDVENILHTVSTPTFLHLSSGTDSSTFVLITPLVQYNKTIGVMLFFLNNSELTRFSSDSDSRLTYILDKNHLERDTSKIDLNLVPTLTPTYLNNQLSTLSPENNFANFSIDDYTLYSFIPFDICDHLVFLTLTPNKTIFGAIDLLNSCMFLIILITIIVVLIVSLYLLHQNNTPLDYLNDTFYALSKHNNHLTSQVNETIPMQKYFLLAQLVSGKVSHIGVFMEKCAEVDLYFNSAYYTILITLSHSRNFSLETTIVDSIDVLQNTHIESSYPVQHIYPNMDIYLLGSSTNLTLPKLELPQAILYFGPSCDSLSNVAKSYIEARTLADMSEINQKQIYTVTEMLSIYKAHTYQLQTLLEEKSFMGISKLILLVIQTMEEQDLNFVLRKSICLEIIVTFNNYFDSNHFFDYETMNLFSLYKIQTYTELKEIFIEITSEMLQLLISHSSNTKEALSSTLIEEYIGIHLADFHLNSMQIAKYFYTSPHYIENLFLEHTHCSIEKYIEEMRLSKACELLIHTPYTLKIISEQVGFSHISTFISTFKIKYKLTPGQYRSLHQNEEATSSL